MSKARKAKAKRPAILQCREGAEFAALDISIDNLDGVSELFDQHKLSFVEWTEDAALQVGINESGIYRVEGRDRYFKAGDVIYL